MTTLYNRQRRREAGKLPHPQAPAANAASGPGGPGLPYLPAWVYPVAAVVLALLWYASGGGSIDDEQLNADIYCAAVADGHIAQDRAHDCPTARAAAASGASAPASAP